MKTPKAPRAYPPIECPPCRHDCAALWECADPKTCVHVDPLLSDRALAWAMLAICIALAIFALVGWL